MHTTPRHTATLMGTALAASLVLGACVEPTPSDEANDSPQAVSQEADPAQDARQANQQRLSQLTLQELRAIYPTAGLEVPPVDVSRSTVIHSTAGLEVPPAGLSRSTQAEKVAQDDVPTGRFARHPE